MPRTSSGRFARPSSTCDGRCGRRGGAYFASQDADSEGVEGKFFVWTPDQVEEVLGDRAEAFCVAYGVRAGGNFEHGTTHLVDEARGPRERFRQERERLYAARRTRVPPATDPKHVTAWNAYVISGLARAASLIGDARALEDAEAAVRFLLGECVDEKNQLFRVHNDGRAHVSGFLDDHAGPARRVPGPATGGRRKSLPRAGGLVGPGDPRPLRRS